MSKFFEPFSIEEIREMAVDHNYDEILVTAIRAKRISVKGKRFYYYVEDDDFLGDVISPFYPSVTTVTDFGARLDDSLLQWYGNKGYENAREYVNQRRDYGTFIHIIYAEYLLAVSLYGRGVHLYAEDVWSIWKDYCEMIGRGEKFAERNIKEILKDLAAFRKWCIDYNVKPLLIETPVIDQARGVATTLDLLAEISVGDRYKSGPRKGVLKKPELASRAVAHIEFKSTKNTELQENHKLQVLITRDAIRATFPLLELGPSLVYKASDWKTTPGYHIKEVRDDDRERANVEPIVTLAHNRLKGVDSWSYKTTVDGILGLTDETGFKFETKTVREVVEEYERGGLFQGIRKDVKIENEIGDLIASTIRRKEAPVLETVDKPELEPGAGDRAGGVPGQVEITVNESIE